MPPSICTCEFYLYLIAASELPLYSPTTNNAKQTKPIDRRIAIYNVISLVCRCTFNIYTNEKPRISLDAQSGYLSIGHD